MAETARAVVFEAPETFVLRDIPLPDLGPDDLLIRVGLCGVDGSELHMFRGELPWFNERIPIIFGDEIVGTVAAIGDRAKETRKLEIGDRVAVEARWPCNDCRYCAQGQYYLCANNAAGRGYGTISAKESPALWGGYATHTFVPKEALVYRLPAVLDDRAALVSCSLLANSMRWTEQAGAVAGSTLAVIGPGPQGLGCALVAADIGAKVVLIGLERDAGRLEFAKSLGNIETVTIPDGEDVGAVIDRILAILGEVDAVIETAGAAAAKELAFKLVRPTGRVAQVSLPFPLIQSVDWLQLLMKEVTVVNPVSHPHFVAAGLTLGADLLARGIDVGSFISHVFPLEGAAEALRTASYQSGQMPIKIALDPALQGGAA